MTPIQLIQAFTTIANEGVMLKPYLVEKIIDKKGTVVYEGKKEEVAKVFKKETTDHLQKLLHDAIYDGVAKAYQPSNVNIIGKTGTAQIASPKGGYLKGKTDYVRSFAALFPQEDPQYILYIALKQFAHPSPITTIAKYSVKAIEEIASYTKTTKSDITYKINQMFTLDNYISKKTEILNNQNLNFIVLGDGKYIIDQYPLKNTSVFKEDKIFIKTSSEDYLMPSLIGYTLSEVDILVKLLGLKLEYIGTGRVTSQDIERGSIVQKDDILKIELN
jgi:penicillin-binding protein 2B